MGLGSSLIGAIVGAAIGMGAQIGLERWMGVEASWFAIVIGLVTGLGARAMAGEFIKQTSYLRGAVTAVIALAAIFAGSYFGSAMLKAKSVREYEAKAPPAAVPQQIEADEDDSEPAEMEAAPTEDEVPAEDEPAEGARDESAPAEEGTDDGAADEPADADVDDEQPQAAPRSLISQLEMPPQEKPGELPTSPWDFAFFAIGTFVAYEFARGGDGKKRAPATEEA